MGMGMTFMYLSKYSSPVFRLKELALAGSHSDYAILVAHLREKTKQRYFPEQTSVQQSFSEIHWSPLEIITQGHTVSYLLFIQNGTLLPGPVFKQRTV